MPDIDMDFDDERRGEVIEYVREKYGADKVAQIITFGTMKARAAVRDAGRVLGYPYGVPDKIAQDDPEDARRDHRRVARRQNAEFKADYDANRGHQAHRRRRALRSRASSRGEGVHAAGVVICRDPLHYYVPVKYDTKGGAVITQYDGPLVAESGLLKMDFLGLRTLTVIADAVRERRANPAWSSTSTTIPLDDADDVRAAAAGRHRRRVPARVAGDAAAAQALSPDLRRHRRGAGALPARVRWSRAWSTTSSTARTGKRGHLLRRRLKPILEETYGAIVYQEQVMRIALEMAGFSAAKADKLRKAMGKKQPTCSRRSRATGSTGAAGATATTPSSPSACGRTSRSSPSTPSTRATRRPTALITIQTAYLKAHYPLEYMAAVLTSYTGKTDEDRPLRRRVQPRRHTRFCRRT